MSGAIWYEIIATNRHGVNVDGSGTETLELARGTVLRFARKHPDCMQWSSDFDLHVGY